jgi:shikimate dehydrogenase
VSASAALYGLIANPAGHSVSPAMHNAAFRAGGLDAVYLPLQAVDADDVLAAASRIGLRGASVTIPFKVDLLPHCQADLLSARVGAVNTLRWDADALQGRNTDVEGLLRPLHSLGNLQGLRATILGAGGAARAAAIALADAGVAVTVCARRLDRAQAVAHNAGAAAAPMPPAPGSWDLLVNATAAGMYPHVNDTAWPHGRFDGRLVYDLVYNPPDTRLLRDARAAGCATLGGVEMLVAQADAQFRFWTGQAPAPGVMHRAALARLAQFAAPRPARPSVSPS